MLMNVNVSIILSNVLFSSFFAACLEFFKNITWDFLTSFSYLCFTVLSACLAFLLTDLQREQEANKPNISLLPFSFMLDSHHQPN